jgi:O-antigen ligase
MSPAVRTDTATSTAPARRFSAWPIGVWVLLLLAAMGSVQYLQHAEYAYLLAALLIIVVCAGCILRQAWARPITQVLAVLLALWALVSGLLMLQQWGDFETAREHAQALPQLGEVALWMIARAQRTWQVGLALKAIAMPLLLWVAWQLGRPAVRAQFKRRR